MPSYRVTVAGQSYDVEVPDPSERPVRAIVNGQVFEVHIASDADGPGRVVADSAAAPKPVPAPRPADSVSSSRTAVPATTGHAPTGDVEISAPLPGTIVSISVAEGESVTHGQELCILEAMKMNNPIRATQAGMVKEILVSVGEQVQHGIPLMVIEASGRAVET
jgi:biotin carboxyl carrier protein